MAIQQKNHLMFNFLLSFMTVGLFSVPAAHAQMRHDRDGRGGGDRQDHGRPNTNDGRGGRPERGPGRPDTNEGRDHRRPSDGRPGNDRPDHNWPDRDHGRPNNDRPDHGGPRPGHGGGNGGGWPRPDRPDNHWPDRDHNHGRPGNGHHAPPYVPPYVPPYQPPYVPPPSYEPPVYQPPAYEPAPPVYEPAPAVDVASAQVDFTGITRKTGGEWLRVSLAAPMSLAFFEVYVQTAAVQIHEAYLLTRSGLRIPISDLSETGTFTAGDERTTSDLSEVDGVIAIDLRVEAMGALANVSVTVYSEEGVPTLKGSRP